MFSVGSLLSSLTLNCSSTGHNPWIVVSKGNSQGYLSHSLPFAWFHHKCSQHFARKPSAGPSSKALVIQQSVHDTELNHRRDASLSQQHGRQLATTTLSERAILWLQRSSGELRRKWVDLSTLQMLSEKSIWRHIVWNLKEKKRASEPDRDKRHPKIWLTFLVSRFQKALEILEIEDFLPQENEHCSSSSVNRTESSFSSQSFLWEWVSTFAQWRHLWTSKYG